MIQLDKDKILYFAERSIKSGKRTYENVDNMLYTLVPADIYRYVMDKIEYLHPRNQNSSD